MSFSLYNTYKQGKQNVHLYFLSCLSFSSKAASFFFFFQLRNLIWCIIDIMYKVPFMPRVLRKRWRGSQRGAPYHPQTHRPTPLPTQLWGCSTRWLVVAFAQWQPQLFESTDPISTFCFRRRREANQENSSKTWQSAWSCVLIRFLLETKQVSFPFHCQCWLVCVRNCVIVVLALLVFVCVVSGNIPIENTQTSLHPKLLCF